MKNIAELFEELGTTRLGMLHAHPGDYVLHAHAIEAARNMGIRMHQMTLTSGPTPDLITMGARVEENRAAERLLGIVPGGMTSCPTGRLRASSGVVRRVTQWVRGARLDMLLTTGGLPDHADYPITGVIALLAGVTAEEQDPLHAVGILDLRAGRDGDTGDIEVGADIRAPQTPEGTALAYRLAHLQPSRFQVVDQPFDGVDEIIERGGLYIHPDTYAELRHYPIEGAATYGFRMAGVVMGGIRAALASKTE